jgi:hypothetical protein
VGDPDSLLIGSSFTSCPPLFKRFFHSFRVASFSLCHNEYNHFSYLAF